MKEFKNTDINDALNSTDIYDTLYPIIKKKIADPATFQKILKISKDFFTKNESKLLTNIVGKQVLVSAKMEEDLLDSLGLDKAFVKKTILDSGYFKTTFGRELSLTDQFCIAFPLILASLEYKFIKKQDASDLCYLLAHFKPYASRESFLFKYGVKESQMLYTIEKALSERFDIKKYGTILSAISKRANSSYNNYIANMEKGEKYSDKKLYVTYTSGVVGNVNTFIGAIYEVYMKNDGKSLSFDASATSVDNEGEEEFEDADIASDASLKRKVIDKVLLKLTRAPINKALIINAAKFGFGSTSPQYSEMLTNAVDEIVDKMFNDLDPFFSALISSFLFHPKANGNGLYTMEDFKSPVFIAVGIDILAGKKSNLKDINLLKSREIFKKMITSHSIEYLSFKDTYRRKFEKALAAYWVYFIKTA